MELDGREDKLESVFMNGANSNEDWSEDTIIRCGFVDDMFGTSRDQVDKGAEAHWQDTA